MGNAGSLDSLRLARIHSIGKRLPATNTRDSLTQILTEETLISHGHGHGLFILATYTSPHTVIGRIERILLLTHRTHTTVENVYEYMTHAVTQSPSGLLDLIRGAHEKSPRLRPSRSRSRSRQQCIRTTNSEPLSPLIIKVHAAWRFSL
jgi:hypothetical protein